MMVSKNDYFKSDKGQEMRPEYAQVGAIADNGEPLLRFSGEQMVGHKIYPRLASYSDISIGDRVMVLNGIILGKWVHNAS